MTLKLAGESTYNSYLILKLLFQTYCCLIPNFHIQGTALLILVVIIALNLAVGFIPKVDNSAHIGGFLAGLFLGFVLLVRPQFGYVSRKYIPTSYNGQLKSRHKWYQYVLGITAAIILVLG